MILRAMEEVNELKLKPFILSQLMLFAFASAVHICVRTFSLQVKIEPGFKLHNIT